MVTTGLKVLCAGSTLHGMRPCADAFARNAKIPVQLATDHGHCIHQTALRGEADADVILLPTHWIDDIVAAGLADEETAIAIGAVRIGAVVPTRRARTCRRWTRYAVRCWRRMPCC